MSDIVKPNADCDSDGCLAAFDEHVFAFLGVWPGHDLMWERIAAIPDFWPTIPLKYGAKELWESLKLFKPRVLTGCPKGHYEIAAAHKVEWHKKHFGQDVEVITCLSRNKPLHMRAPGDILIDDFRRHIRRWEKAGGRGIHYRTHEQAMEDFKLAVLAVGDLIQVEINDAFCLDRPEPVIDIQTHEEKHWVFVASTQTGIPIRNVVLVSKTG